MLNVRDNATKKLFKFIASLLLALTALSLGACDSNPDGASPSDKNVVTDAGQKIIESADPSIVANDRGELKRGQYRYFADAATFTECGTGQSWPIAPSEKAADVERAYLDATSQDSLSMQPIILSIETHIDVIEGMEPGMQMPHLVVDRFLGIDSDQQCDLPQADLVGTYWRLNRVANFDAMSADLREDVRQEPHIILADDGNLKGHDGCNAMFGQYTLNDDSLKFGNIAGTRMACAKIMALGSALHLALGNAASYRIDGQYLYLETESGQLLATLESVYLY